MRQARHAYHNPWHGHESCGHFLCNFRLILSFVRTSDNTQRSCASLKNKLLSRALINTVQFPAVRQPQSSLFFERAILYIVRVKSTFAIVHHIKYLIFLQDFLHFLCHPRGDHHVYYTPIQTEFVHVERFANRTELDGRKFYSVPRSCSHLILIVIRES